MADEETMLAKEAAGAVPLRNTKTGYEVTMETVRGLLKTYSEVMATNASITVDDGLEQQGNLLRAIKMLLRLDGTDFIQGWDELLQWVNSELNGVMGPRFRNRFLDKLVTMARRDRDLLERLIHLITATADGQARAAVARRYDWGRVQRVIADRTQAEKLEGYYQQFV